jgi:transcription elongation GreA/GreB family factor
MNKVAIVDAILLAIETELESCRAAARDAGRAATDPDSKAENKYDTRNLEASYIARGQALRLDELTAALQDYQELRHIAGNPRNKVRIGALVLLESEDEDTFYFIGPAMGGLEVKVERHEIQVLTPSSPLGGKLMGQEIGYAFELRTGSPSTRREILDIE